MDDNQRTEPSGTPFEDDELDEAVIAADDTGMLAGERTITRAELEEGDADAGDV